MYLLKMSDWQAKKMLISSQVLRHKLERRLTGLIDLSKWMRRDLVGSRLLLATDSRRHLWDSTLAIFGTRIIGSLQAFHKALAFPVEGREKWKKDLQIWDQHLTMPRYQLTCTLLIWSKEPKNNSDDSPSPPLSTDAKLLWLKTWQFNVCVVLYLDLCDKGKCKCILIG